MKILIIAQHIFPIQTPRSHRTTELIKEFARQGHNITVYAVLGKYDYSIFEKQYNVTVKKNPIKWQISTYNSDGNGKRTLLDKILGKLLGKLLQFPNIEFLFNIPSIIKKEKQVDLLISIADPHHIHWGCARAKKKHFKIFPKLWIADCGDPFMENGKTKYHYKYFAKFEKSFCSLCDFITVPISSAIDAYYPEYRHKIKVIPQGFSFDLPIKENLEPQNNVLTFAYSGTFLKDIRNPKLFLEFLCNLKIDFKFIVFSQFNDLILPYKEILKHKLEIRELINRNELIEVLKTMDFLVNIENFNCPNQSPSKLIDYSIANRPILSINPNNLDFEKINKFLNKDYSNKLIIDNIEQYHISNVVNKFIKLT